jgi:hypothetical protein
MDQLLPIKSATRERLYRLLPLVIILLAAVLRFHQIAKLLRTFAGQTVLF